MIITLYSTLIFNIKIVKVLMSFIFYINILIFILFIIQCFNHYNIDVDYNNKKLFLNQSLILIRKRNNDTRLKLIICFVDSF